MRRAFVPSRDRRVVLGNGGALTGEIQQLDQGKLRLKTSDPGTVYGEWNRMDRIDTSYGFLVAEQSGTRSWGTLSSEEGAPGCTSRRRDGHDPVLAGIVGLNPVDEGVLARVDGNLSLGYSHNKDSDFVQWIASGSLDRRERILGHSPDFSPTARRAR